MKFELNPSNRNISNDDLMADLRRVALILKSDSISTTQYTEYGKYHPTTFCNRFGSWNNALELSGLELKKYAKIDKEDPHK